MKFHTFTHGLTAFQLFVLKMKKLSILILLVGIAITVGLVIYYRPENNPVDSTPAAINGSGEMTAQWPMFVGILTTFVGAVFFYVSHYGKKTE